MYGTNYGYRSGLNASMVRHLSSKASQLSGFVNLQANDWVLDIGSNDGTLLKSYGRNDLNLVGMDPTGKKFRDLYPRNVQLIADFFSRDRFRSVASSAKAKLITSIAMFYDLEDPIAFAQEIHSCLDDNGIWHFEQSYMPSMLRMKSYDTVCHEHLEYYSLAAVLKILESADLEAVDVTMNAINGGSFAVTACKKGASFTRNLPIIEWLCEAEIHMGLHTPRPFRDFEEAVFEHRRSLTKLIRRLQAAGKKVFGYGASTKGNVLLQFCGFSSAEIPYIVDVNPDKFGCVTPGTHIPIISEEEGRAKRPDYFLVLPWHFKPGIIQREEKYLASGGHLIFPLPEIEIV
jgi:hypothetical protein